MFNKASKFSHVAQKQERHRILRTILIVLALYLLYNVISALFLSVWVLHNDSMQPGLRSGDRFLVASSVLPSLVAELRGDGASPFKRGSVILIDIGREAKQNWFLYFTDTLVRFFTAQKISIFQAEETLFIKRLIALPGDEISMANFVMRVKTADSDFTLTEFELADRPYQPNIPQVPALWDDSLPFSGNMDRIVLGPGEYFVVSDDRANTADSRTWGPVSAKNIIGKPVFRFWPLSRTGRP